MKTPSRSRRLVLATATIAALPLTAGIGWRASASPPLPPPPPPRSRRDRRTRRNRTWDGFTGRLEAVDRVDMRSRVASAVHPSISPRRAGSPRRPPRDHRSTLRGRGRSRGARSSRRARLASRATASARASGKSAIARRRLDERVNGSSGRGQPQGAEAALQSARLNLSYTEVRAGPRPRGTSSHRRQPGGRRPRPCSPRSSR
jgi:multidrug efflux system membrane fusion protein